MADMLFGRLFAAKLLKWLIPGEGTTMIILSADPTTTPTGSPNMGDYGTYNGRLYLHTTSAIDTFWIDLTALTEASCGFVRRVLVTADPTINPPVQEYPVGTIAYMHGGIEGTLCWAKTYPGEDNPSQHWIALPREADVSVYGMLCQLHDLGGKVWMNRIQNNLYGGDPNAVAVIRCMNGQPSAIVNNDKLHFPFNDNSPGRIQLEFKRTSGFVPTAGYSTVDISGLVDSNDDTAPAAVCHAIRDVLASGIPGGGQWAGTAEDAYHSGSDWWHSMDYLSTAGDGEMRGDAPYWELATPAAHFTGFTLRMGYSPLVDAHGVPYNNLTRLGPYDVACLIALMKRNPNYGPTAIFRANFNIDYTMFAGGGAAKTIRLSPDLPLGAIIVAANSHNNHAWDAPLLATLTLEFDDQDNGTAYVLKPFSGTDTTAGSTLGRAPNGRWVQYLTCTARITGDTLDHLTNGTAELEVLYSIP